MSCFLPALVLALAAPAPQGPQSFNPPRPHFQPAPVVAPSTPGAVRAALVRSWNSGLASAWGELNRDWSLYGRVPIAIDASLGGADVFTYAELVASGADVVILSDPCGGNQQFSAQEVADLEQYVAEGHNLIGTYLTFYRDTGTNLYDNRALTPLFGFAPGLAFAPYSSDQPISNQFRLLRTSPLFRGMVLTSTGTLRGRTWDSHGYAYTQVEADLRWDAEELGAARPVAQCDDRHGIVTVYDAPTYSALYFSNMPEWYGERNDKQLLYNAITYKHP
jgi:hypothetical protein